MRSQLLFCLLFLSVATANFAQQTLQTPSEFLPHQLGENFTPHYLQVDYFEYVAANSPRVQKVNYGQTNEARPLNVFIISTPENLKNIEAIREANLREAGLIDGRGEAASKAIVWLSFGVHGNEAGASESSMAALYELANPTNTETEAWLKDAVVIIDPSVNPDGYSRYSHWYRGIAGKMNDPAYIAREHREPWPTGRVNHYMFDLNRDWAWATQVETQQRLKIYHEWMPHIHADVHEQYPDNPYYFAPAAAPFHPSITKWQGDFQTEIGQNHARHFDKEGWLYFTREVFDLFYPSYGDTYPTFNGAIGMTYEQAGHGISGRAILMENGDTLTLHDRVHHHETTALSTVEIAAKNAARLNKEFANYFNKNQNNPQGKYKSFIISSKNPKEKIEALTSFLDLHKIKYGIAKNGKNMRAYDYETMTERNVQVGANDLIISAYQPMGLLAQVLFEPAAELEDSLTYDITAWAIPYAHGLQAYATSSKLEPGAAYQAKNTALNGRPDVQTYALVANWQTMNDARFLSAILQKGIKVRYAEEAFAINGDSYSPGTIIITRADNRKNENWQNIAYEAAAAEGQELTTLRSGFSTSGHDLGSDKMQFLEMPKVMIVGGEGTNANSFGHLWHYFEKDLSYPVTVVNAKDFSANKIDDYNLLVLTDGRYGLKDKDLEALQAWMSRGGRIISVGAANRAFADKSGFSLKKAKRTSSEKDELQPYAGRERRSISDYMPGAIYRLNIDNTHPLGFGLPDHYFSLKTTGNAYDYLSNGWNVGYLDDNPQFLGFVGANVQPQMKETVCFAVQDKGQGSITYMVDNPLYRGFWEQGKFLFSNAVFFVGN